MDMISESKPLHLMEINNLVVFPSDNELQSCEGGIKYAFTYILSTPSNSLSLPLVHIQTNRTD